MRNVYFLDVYGDTTILVDRFDQCNVVIDTGEADTYDTVIHFLRSKHIQRIDYFILSHFHSDHVGEADDIINEFQVDQVITKYNASNYEGQRISCGGIELFLFPMSYDAVNENDNSIILTATISDRTYMFVGDTEVHREADFIAMYDIDVDYLKVGHHGSITSSSESFIDHLKPEEAFIIVSRDNRHGHPHDLIVERFHQRDIPIHRTDEHGTIQVTYLFGKERKKYHRP